MATIGVSTKQTTERKVKIPVPSFWKDAYGELCAVLDTETAVRVYTNPNASYTNISLGSPDTIDSTIANAHANWTIITEEEFMDAYNKAHESIRLKPELVKQEEIGI